MSSIIKVDTIQDAGGNQIFTSDGNGVITGNLSARPAFGATATHTLTNDTAEKITFDTEIYDTDNAFDSTTNYRFTVPTGADGKYIIYANLMTGAAVDDGEKLETRIYKNGVEHIKSQYFSPASNKSITASISATLDLVATDYIEIFGYQNSGTNSALTNTMFYGYKLPGV